MTDRPSTLAAVVAAAARVGDASDPATLAAAARDERITQAAAALHEAHLAVADAAGDWYDTEQDEPDERRDTRDGLRAAVERWRAAGEAFVRATRAGSGS